MSSPTAEAEAPHTGRCLCGKISYELRGQPIFSGLCHCSNCKQWTGAESGWYVFFNKEQISYTKGQDTLGIYDDTETARGVTLRRNFCPTCGSSLTVVLTAREEMTGVAVGTLEGDIYEMWKPQAELYCKRRPKWLPDFGVTQFELTPN
ncbi:Mss4-like protein [Irpex lacteus]|nr:Mss4-like protein [Irpex lacteus]